MPILAQVTEYMERPDEQVVVLFQILAAEINFGYKFQCVRCSAASRAASKLQDCLCIATGCKTPACRPHCSGAGLQNSYQCVAAACVGALHAAPWQLKGWLAATLISVVLHV